MSTFAPFTLLLIRLVVSVSLFLLALVAIEKTWELWRYRYRDGNLEHCGPWWDWRWSTGRRA